MLILARKYFWLYGIYHTVIVTCMFVKQMMAQSQATTKTMAYNEPVGPLKQIGTTYGLSRKAVTDAHPAYENF